MARRKTRSAKERKAAENTEKVEMLSMPKPLLEAILNYLGDRPWKEASPFIQAVQDQVKVIGNEHNGVDKRGKKAVAGAVNNDSDD